MLEDVVESSMMNVDVWQIIMYSGASVLLGVLVACVHMYRNTYSQSFIVTLTILPILVQSVIMLVNGNVGTGIAVLGAFSLIRFRSVAGGAREISSIFLVYGNWPRDWNGISYVRAHFLCLCCDCSDCFNTHQIRFKK